MKYTHERRLRDDPKTKYKYSEKKPGICNSRGAVCHNARTCKKRNPYLLIDFVFRSLVSFIHDQPNPQPCFDANRREVLLM